MKIAGSARSVCCYQRSFPPKRALLRGVSEAKSLPKRVSGGCYGLSWEKDGPRPSPNQSLLSRMAGFVSVLRVTDDCDEKGHNAGHVARTPQVGGASNSDSGNLLGRRRLNVLRKLG